MLNKYFKFTLIFLILAELFSIFAWGLPQFNLICFGVILAMTLVLSLIKLEYGIYLAFTVDGSRRMKKAVAIHVILLTGREQNEKNNRNISNSGLLYDGWACNGSSG